MMSEKIFDRILTGALLMFSAWYCVSMLLYPSNAGRIPAIVASVAIGALLVQLWLSFRSRRAAPSTVAEIPSVPDQPYLPRVEAESNEPEKDTYDTLLAVRGKRLRRLLMICGFILAFYLSSILVGFVVTSAVLIPAIFLMARERIWVALIGGAVAAVASYLLVVQLLGLPLIQGYLVGG